MKYILRLTRSFLVWVLIGAGCSGGDGGRAVDHEECYVGTIVDSFDRLECLQLGYSGLCTSS